MSAPDKPDPARGWKYVENVGEAEADRVAGLSDDEFDREMASRPGPGAIPSMRELLHKAEARASTDADALRAAHRALRGEDAERATGARPKRSRRRAVRAVVGWGLGIGLAAAVGLVVWGRWLRDTPSVGDHPVSAPNQSIAEIREEGLAYCDKGEWAKCLMDLDDAKRNDPDGDLSPAVQEARKRAAKALHP